MKKILIVVFLLQNWSVFAQTQVKLNLGALAFKRLDIHAEQRIKKIGLELNASCSKTNIVIDGNTNTNLRTKVRLGYGGSIRYYFSEKPIVSLFWGGIYQVNRQRFQVLQNTFQRNESFAGLLFGSKFKLSRKLFLETGMGISFYQKKTYTDISRKIELGEYYTIPNTNSTWLWINSFNSPNIKNTFLFNFAIIYQFKK